MARLWRAIFTMYIYPTAEQLRQILKDNKTALSGKRIHIELTVALIFENFVRSKTQIPWVIGLPLTRTHDLDKTGVTRLPNDKLLKIILKDIETKTITDFSVIPLERAISNHPQGLHYQLKHIGNKNWKGDTDNIIEFIKEKVSGKYPPSTINTHHLILLLTPQVPIPLQFEKINDYLQKNPLPFASVKYCATSGSGESTTVIIGEIFPEIWQVEKKVTTILEGH